MRRTDVTLDTPSETPKTPTVAPIIMTVRSQRPVTASEPNRKTASTTTPNDATAITLPVRSARPDTPVATCSAKAVRRSEERRVAKEIASQETQYHRTRTT